MDKLELKGEWNKIKGKVKQVHADLTNEALKYGDGQDEKQPKNIFSKKQPEQQMTSSNGYVDLDKNIE